MPKVDGVCYGTDLFWCGTAAAVPASRLSHQTTKNWRLNMLLLSCDRLIKTFPLKNKRHLTDSGYEKERKGLKVDE